MNSKFNIGIIGAGMIGDVHLEKIRQDGRGRVTWIASRTEDTLSRKLKKYNVPNGSTDYRDMLDDTTLNAVVIAAPPFLHPEMLQDALQSGKHVLLEKPMVANPEQLDRIVRLAGEYKDLMILECSCRHARLQPKFNAVRDMIRDGVLGEIYHIHHNHLMRSTFIEYNPAGTWAHRKELAGGGPFMDWGVYDLSFHLGILDDIPGLSSVQAFTRSGLKHYRIPGFYSDIEEHGAAYMNFDTGLTYYYERGSGVPFETGNETRIYGTLGGLRISYCSWDAPEMTLFLTDENRAGMTERRVVQEAADHDDNLALTTHFLDCLEGISEPAMTVSLAAKHLRILFQILGQTSHSSKKS
ncbi:Gfo/Idh/MocA family oxidoreductase [bacterium]|nr:Gfo/Idh/MocA family oxidoreductase [bacterium]